MVTNTIVAAKGVTGRLSLPANPVATLAAGGSLPSGTAQYYVITALDADGETLKSSEVTATPTGANLTIDVSWDVVTGATSYKVYRSTTTGTYGATSLLANPTTNSHSDDGGVSLQTGTPPTSYDPEIVVGAEISVKDFDVFALYTDYSKGAEDGLILKSYGLAVSGGDEHQLGSYDNASGVLTQQVRQVDYTNSGKKVPVVYDVRGVNFVKVYQKRKGTTVATGTFDLSYVKTFK